MSKEVKRFSFAHLMSSASALVTGAPTPTAAEGATSQNASVDAAADNTGTTAPAATADAAAATGSDGVDGDEDGDENDDEDDEQANAVRVEERARCAAIFASSEAAGRIGMAAELAFNSDMPADKAISLLKMTPRQSAGKLAKAMETLGNPQVGADAGAAPATGSADAIAASIIAAGQSLRGVKKQ